MPSSTPEPEALSTEDFARWWKETGEHELRQILFWKWDPIGAFDSSPNTTDEYDLRPASSWGPATRGI